MSSTSRLHGQHGFTLLEVMVAIVITAIAVFGVAGAVLHALHAAAQSELHATLDDDALAALSDVRMLTAYDATTLAKLTGKTSSMSRALGSGDRETITLSVSGLPGSVTVVAGRPAIVQSSEVATAVATAASDSVTERITLYAQAPAPGSVVEP